MKKYILLAIGLIVAILVPITLFNVMGFHFEKDQLDVEQVITKAEYMNEEFQAGGMDTDNHRRHRDYLVTYLEDLGFQVTVEAYKQLAPTYSSDFEMTVGKEVIDIRPVFGGRSLGVDFQGDIVFQNLGTSYDESLVKGRVVISTGHGELLDSQVEKLYDAGCRGIITMRGAYRNRSIHDYKKSDGKLIALIEVQEEAFNKLLDLGKESQVEPREISVGTSYTQVDFLTVGLLEEVYIRTQVNIDFKEGYNIYASMGDHKRTTAFATTYDGTGMASDFNLYNNLYAVSTLMSLAEKIAVNEEHLKYQVAFAFLDGGYRNQSGVSHFRKTNYHDDMEVIFISHIGFPERLLEHSSEGSQFLYEKWQQYMLVQEEENRRTYDYFKSMIPGYELLDNFENALVFKFTPQAFDDMFVHKHDLDKDNIKKDLMALEDYTKVEVFGDLYPDYFEAKEWLIVCLLTGLVLMNITLHFFRHHRWVEPLYYTPIFKVFRIICNICLVIIITTCLIIMVSVLPEYFSFRSGSNYSLYSLIKDMTQVLRGLPQGLGISSMGISQVDLVFLYAKKTFSLISLALVLAIGMGLLIGMVTSYLSGHKSKQQSLLVILGLSLPELVVIVGLLFSMKYIMDISLVSNLIETSDLREFIMPLFVLSLVPTIYVARSVYICLVEEQQKKYIISLKAKGVKKMRLYSHHFLKVALHKVLSQMAILITILISTMIICDRMFALNGIFLAILESMANKDYNFYISLVLTVMTFYFLVIIVSKFIAGRLIPRRGGAYEME